jgi:hypothetical protein
MFEEGVDLLGERAERQAVGVAQRTEQQEE